MNLHTHNWHLFPKELSFRKWVPPLKPNAKASRKLCAACDFFGFEREPSDDSGAEGDWQSIGGFFSGAHVAHVIYVIYDNKPRDFVRRGLAEGDFAGEEVESGNAGDCPHNSAERPELIEMLLVGGYEIVNVG